MQSKPRVHADPLINQDDPFDQVPDPIILHILNKVSDIRTLGRISSVSKRFNSLVPLVHDINIKIDRVVTSDADTYETSTSTSPKPRNILSHIVKFMFLTFLKPFHNLRTSNGGNKPLFPQVAHHSPSQVLKNFTHVRNLKIELPNGDVGAEEGMVLKWRAEFGSTLENCVILGGTRIDCRPRESSLEDNGNIPESFYTNGGLKLRVVWTISSLIAASTRHYLWRSIVKEHPTLRSLVLTDSDGQGMLVMGVEQLKEFRESQLFASASSNRTHVPPSNMKLRYCPYLELSDGMGMEGATLVTIRPSDVGGGGGVGVGCSRKEAEAFVYGAFDGRFRDAVKALVKRRTYLLEMNGF